MWLIEINISLDDGLAPDRIVFKMTLQGEIITLLTNHHPRDFVTSMLFVQWELLHSHASNRKIYIFLYDHHTEGEMSFKEIFSTGCTRSCHEDAVNSYIEIWQNLPDPLPSSHENAVATNTFVSFYFLCQPMIPVPEDP